MLDFALNLVKPAASYLNAMEKFESKLKGILMKKEKSKENTSEIFVGAILIQRDD